MSLLQELLALNEEAKGGHDEADLNKAMKQFNISKEEAVKLLDYIHHDGKEPSDRVWSGISEYYTDKHHELNRGGDSDMSEKITEYLMDDFS